MAVAQRTGYGWSLPGLRQNATPAASEVNNVRVFSAKGLSAPGVLGTSPLPQIGVPIPGTFLVYIRPRLSQDEGLLSGGGGSQFATFSYPGGPSRSIQVYPNAADAVTITNPLYNFYRRNQRTRSVGAAGAGSLGRNMDVPFQNDVPYFARP